MEIFHIAFSLAWWYDASSRWAGVLTCQVPRRDGGRERERERERDGVSSSCRCRLHQIFHYHFLQDYDRRSAKRFDQKAGRNFSCGDLAWFGQTWHTYIERYWHRLTFSWGVTMNYIHLLKHPSEYDENIKITTSAVFVSWFSESGQAAFQLQVSVWCWWRWRSCDCCTTALNCPACPRPRGPPGASPGCGRHSPLMFPLGSLGHFNMTTN